MKNAKAKSSNKTSFIKSFSDNTTKIGRPDWILIGILVVIYAILAFPSLGTTKSPKTYYHFEFAGEDVGLELTSDAAEISKMRYYTGPEVGDFTILVSTDGEEFNNYMNFSSNSVFSWEEVTIDTAFKYIRFVSNTPGAYLGDVQLYDGQGGKVEALASDDQSEAIADELSTVPNQIGYKNSMYFDEIYFARSAYEYVHGIDVMEWTHPPLGKLIMALPIMLFGMSPFTFRIMGAIAGLLMIPVIYILAKRLFKNQKWALLAGILMTFDTFHFAHTRMATVDSFLVLFILLSVLFMKDYLDLDKNAEFKAKAKKLLLSGLFIGLAIATKWTALYAALGLAIVFFSHLFKENEDGRKKKMNYNTASKAALTGLVMLSLVPIILYYVTLLIENSSMATSRVFCYYLSICVISLFVLIGVLLRKDKALKKTFLMCFIAFILIPLVIYGLTYLLFPNVYNYTNNSISGIFNQIKEMYNYHSNLTEHHFFESKWYEWPIMSKPVWYHVGYYGGNLKSTIVGIGNPVIWWVGIVAGIFALIKTILKREKEMFFILIFILCTFVPYIFISRPMFMYHYFPTLPFIMLAIVSFVKWISDKLKTNSVYVFYTALVIVVFFVFFPVVSGMQTSSEYIDALKWLSTWTF